MLIERAETSMGRLCQRRRCCRGVHMLYLRLLLRPRRSRRAAICAPRDVDMTRLIRWKACFHVYQYANEKKQVVARLRTRRASHLDYQLLSTVWRPKSASPENWLLSPALSSLLPAPIGAVRLDALKPGFLSHHVQHVKAKSKGSRSRLRRAQYHNRMHSIIHQS